MEAIATASWRAFPAAALLALAAVLLVIGLRMLLAGIRRPLADPEKNVLVVRGFRRTLVALLTGSVAAAWLWQSGWVLALAVGIGIVELTESTLMLAGMRGGADIRLSAGRTFPAPERGARSEGPRRLSAR